eukprot:673617_1
MKSLEKHGVVPDVIDVIPESVLLVKYPSGAEVDKGNVLKPREVKDKPTLTWPCKEGALYTVIMTDPDAPSRSEPKFGEWLHWTVVNVPGNDVAKGDVVAEYVGSGPPQGTGLHRYVLLAFLQPAGPISTDEPQMTGRGDGGKHRPKNKVREFAKKYNLGAPVAANFYQAEWDDYVPELYTQLKG